MISVRTHGTRRRVHSLIPVPRCHHGDLLHSRGTAVMGDIVAGVRHAPARGPVAVAEHASVQCVIRDRLRRSPRSMCAPPPPVRQVWPGVVQEVPCQDRQPRGAWTGCQPFCAVDTRPAWARVPCQSHVPPVVTTTGACGHAQRAPRLRCHHEMVAPGVHTDATQGTPTTMSCWTHPALLLATDRSRTLTRIRVHS